MKKITLYFLVFFTCNIGFAQVTYFNYLDYTSEWRYYSGGWNGFSGYADYTTRYFDGDAVINGQTYYQFYQSIRETTTDFLGNPVVTENVFGPGYMREDANGKFYALALDTFAETEMFDNSSIVNAQIGDLFPYAGATCNVESTENLDLGSQSLKMIRGSVSGTVPWETGSLEGVGVIGLACAVGIESNGYLVCYTKNGNSIHFGTIDCDDFPVPLRIHLKTKAFVADQVVVSPNPAKDHIDISLTDNANHAYQITDLRGSVVARGNFSGNSESVDVSRLDSGVYLLRLDSGSANKIIKQ